MELVSVYGKSCASGCDEERGRLGERLLTGATAEQEFLLLDRLEKFSVRSIVFDPGLDISLVLVHHVLVFHRHRSGCLILNGGSNQK